MFDSVKNASSLFSSVLKAAVTHPVLIVPLGLVWGIYAPLVVYLHFYFDWNSVSAFQGFGVIFGFIFAISVLISASCFMLLEQIRLRTWR